MDPNTRNFVMDIPAGASRSLMADLTGFRLGALYVPDGFEGTSVTFLSHPTGLVSDLRPVYDDEGNEVTVAVAPNRIVGLDHAAGKLAALRYIVLRSGTHAAPQAQSSARAVTYIAKR